MQTILTCAALLVCLTGHSCLSKTAPSDGEKEKQMSRNANIYNQDNPISSNEFFIGQSVGPVSVVEVKINKDKLKGVQNLSLIIKNISDKPITAFRYWIGPPPCLQYEMPAQHIDYGDKLALSQNSGSPSLKPFLPGQLTNLSFEHPRLSEYLSAQNRAGCSPNDKPTISLVKVVFTDGEVWDFTKQANRNP